MVCLEKVYWRILILCLILKFGRIFLVFYGRDGFENILKFFEFIFDEIKDLILNEYFDLKVCIVYYKIMFIYDVYLLVFEIVFLKFIYL